MQPQHTPAEQAQIDQALARNASIPPLRTVDADGNDVFHHEELGALYARNREIDEQTRALTAEKAANTARIVAIEEADQEARRTGVSVALG